jgi:hypothetical protein
VSQLLAQSYTNRGSRERQSYPLAYPPVHVLVTRWEGSCWRRPKEAQDAWALSQMVRDPKVNLFVLAIGVVFKPVLDNRSSLSIDRQTWITLRLTIRSTLKGESHG